MKERRPDLSNDLLTREEGAVYARVSVSTMDRARYAGRLRFARTNGDSGKVLIRRRWIDAWLSALTITVLTLVVLTLACHTACRYSEVYRDVMQSVYCPFAE